MPQWQMSWGKAGGRCRFLYADICDAMKEKKWLDNVWVCFRDPYDSISILNHAGTFIVVVKRMWRNFFKRLDTVEEELLTLFSSISTQASSVVSEEHEKGVQTEVGTCNKMMLTHTVGYSFASLHCVWQADMCSIMCGWYAQVKSVELPIMPTFSGKFQSTLHTPHATSPQHGHHGGWRTGGHFNLTSRYVISPLY